HTLSLNSITPVTCTCFTFFSHDPAPTEISTLSLHDALPIWTAPTKTARTRTAPTKMAPTKTVTTTSATHLSGTKRKSTTTGTKSPTMAISSKPTGGHKAKHLKTAKLGTSG